MGAELSSAGAAEGAGSLLEQAASTKASATAGADLMARS